MIRAFYENMIRAFYANMIRAFYENMIRAFYENMIRAVYEQQCCRGRLVLVGCCNLKPVESRRLDIYVWSPAYQTYFKVTLEVILLFVLDNVVVTDCHGDH